MQSLALLTAEMRSMGIRRLEVELDPAQADTIPAAAVEHDEPALAPKPSDVCVFGDCQKKREGIMGGSVAGKYCREHAFHEMGVAT